MQKRTILGLVLFLTTILAPFSSHAQENDLVLPHPNELFGQDVQLLEGIAVHSINFDDPTVYASDGEAWQAYDVPDGINRLNPLPTTPLSLYQSYNMYPNNTYDFWELDSTTHQVALFSSNCGESGNAWLGAYFENQYSRYPTTYHPAPTWVPMHIDEKLYVCSMATGELSHPIDPRFWWLPDNVSPNGEWIVLFALDEPEDTIFAYYAVYGYETATGNTHFLGYWDYGDRSSINWLTDHDFRLWTTTMGTWSTSYRYSGIVNQPNSLDFVMSGFVNSYPRFFDNPPRYELVPRQSQSGRHQPPCTLEVYDLTTRTQHVYDIGNLCDYGIIIPNSHGDRLYISYGEDLSTLLRFNPITGDTETLFSSEIEWLHNVSPDGRYAVIGLDHNGQIDLFPDPPFEVWDFLPLIERTNPVLFDLETQQIVYQFEGVEVPNDLEDGIGDSVTWLSNQDVLVKYADAPDVLYQIQDHQLEATTLEGNILNIIPNHSKLIIQHEDNHTSVFNYETGESTVLTKVYDTETTRQYISIVNDDIVVEFHASIGDETTPVTIDMKWRVEIP